LFAPADAAGEDCVHEVVRGRGSLSAPQARFLKKKARFRGAAADSSWVFARKYEPFFIFFKIKPQNSLTRYLNLLL
jgi:hypothetical protein